MSQPSNSAKDIFLMALDVAPSGRASLLDAECGEDAALRRQVEALLKVHDEPDSLLDNPRISLSIAGVATSEDSSTIDQPITEKAGTQIGPYKLLQQIGEGGMGVVYMAEQSDPVVRRVALKVIKPGMDTRKVIARFEAERQALAMMDYPNIAKVLDAGATDSGRPYFVMELVKGVPVTQYCDKKQLTPRERLELFVPICQAVQHAHQKGIIHRDIKPSNVLVAEYDDRAVPKIIDFGVAKAIEQRLTEKTIFTEFGQVVGTVEYMSPEQAQLNHVDVDTRTDVYSLGVLLYELLTGETPIDGQRLRRAAFDELLRIICEEEPPRPSDKLSTSESLPTIAANRHVEPKKLSTLVYGELDWIVMKALEKDRTRRYDTASKFAEDVEHYLNDEAVTACPPSRAYRIRKLARRNKAAIVTCTAVAAALIVGTGLAAWQAVRATHQRNRAIAAEGQAEEEAGRADEEASRAKEQSKLAESEAAIAKAVNAFLQDDLLGMVSAASQAEAQLSPNPDVKLRTLLDRATDKVEVRFSDQPRVQAAICHTIGNAYHSIGEYQKAEMLLRLALDIRRRTLGEEHLDTLMTTGVLAANYSHQGRYEEAESLTLRALEMFRRTRGEEHLHTVDTMHILATVYELQTRYEEAETLYRQTLESRRRMLGDEHPATLSCMGNLANAYAMQEHYEEAEKLFHQTLELERRTLGDEHPHTLADMQKLATVYADQGRYEEAESLFDRAIKNQRRALGEEHPRTLNTISNLANLYSAQGRYEEAATLNRQTLDIRRRTLGEEHPNTLMSMGNLAGTQLRQGHYEAAEALLRRALDIQRRTLGEEHPDTLNTSNNLSVVCGDQGRHEESEALLRQTLEIQRRTLGDEHSATLNSMMNLAIAYKEQDREREAEPLLKQTLEIRRRTQGDEHPQTLSTMGNLANVYRNQGRYEEAESLLDQAFEIQRRALGEEHPDTLGSMVNLAVIHGRQGRHEEAEALYRRTLEVSRRTLGEEHPITLKTMHNLACACEDQGRYDEAAALFRQTLEISRSTLGEEHPITVATLGNLSWLLATTADPAERDPPKAIELATLATELQPNEPDHWDNLGVALYRNGQFSEAVETLEKARAMRGGNDPEHQFFLAMAYWQTGQRDQALEHYTQAAAWIESGDQGEEEQRFGDEAKNLIRPNEVKENAQEEAAAQELSDE